MISLPGIELQDRDLTLLRDLFESRLMTSSHVAILHFEARSEAAKKRLQKLKAAGLIGVRPRRPTELAVHFLTPKAITLLRTHGALDGYPQLAPLTLTKRAQVSQFTVQHELAVMDVKAAFHSTLKSVASFSIAEFCTWPLLHEFQAYPSNHSTREVLVRPDG